VIWSVVNAATWTVRSAAIADDFRPTMS